MSEKIELVQWHCLECHVFAGSVTEESGMGSAQEHANAYGHVVDAEVTKTVIEHVVVVPR
jgi:hypothetical protein